MQLRVVTLGLLAACGLVLAAGQAQAVSFGYDFTSSDWNSPDFTLVGDAFWANDGGVAPATRLRLTSNGGGQTGSAWLNSDTVDASQAWSAEFTLQMTYEAGGGADGMAFHIHENGTGVNTNFVGSSLTATSLSVSIDTWDNGGEGNFGLRISRGGTAVSGILDLSPIGNPTPDVYQVLLSYDGVSTLGVNVVNTATSAQTGLVNVGPIDLSAMDNAIFGWSANTGGAAENHDIRTFSATFVPEPGTAVLLGTALAGLGWHRRRA